MSGSGGCSAAHADDSLASRKLASLATPPPSCRPYSALSCASATCSLHLHSHLLDVRPRLQHSAHPRRQQPQQQPQLRVNVRVGVGMGQRRVRRVLRAGSFFWVAASKLLRVLRGAGSPEGAGFARARR